MNEIIPLKVYVAMANKYTPAQLREQMKRNMAIVQNGNGNRAVRQAFKKCNLLLSPKTFSRI